MMLVPRVAATIHSPPIASRGLRLQPEAELPDSRKLKGFETDPGSFDSRILRSQEDYDLR